MENLHKRFWAKVNKTDTCWLWTASTKDGVYGQFKYEGQMVRAHRVSYELFVGPIPNGWTIDHLCRVPLCVRPSHLETVPKTINTLRGFGPTAKNKRKTHCISGHLFDETNTFIRKNGNRACRKCACRASYDYRERQKVGTQS